MNLSQKINELKKSGIFEYLDFMKSGYTYNQKEKMQISVKYNDVSIPGVNTEDLILSQIKSQINTTFYNNIISDLFYTEFYSVIDFRNSDFETMFLDNIVNTFKELSGYKNIILSCNLGCLFQEVYSFSSASGKINNSSHIYKIGNLFGYLDIWVDPYMKFNDTRILGFNDVYIDIDNIEINVNNNYTIKPTKIIADFDYSYSKQSSKVLYLLSDDSDPIVFSEYKKIERDIKINKILE